MTEIITKESCWTLKNQVAMFQPFFNKIFSACFLALLFANFMFPYWTLLSGPCRELAFPSFLFFANKRLLNHTIRVLQVQGLDECELRCYHEHNCVSINFKHKVLTSGKYSCELNNSTHDCEHERDLVPDQDHFYRGTKVRWWKLSLIISCTFSFKMCCVSSC